MKRAGLLAAAALAACTPAPAPRLPAPTSAAPTVLAPSPRPPFVLTDAGTAGVDSRLVAQLEAEAAHTHSDVLVVLVHGRVLVHRRFTPEAEHPIELMSLTKSVSALAVAMLLDDGAIESLDVPVSHWFPEWRQGQKQQITLGQLLSHTSGLQDEDDPSEIWQSPDFVQLALAAELVTPPGTAFRYNNKAANLVGEVVRRAGGQRLDQLLRARLFAPLGIEHWEWLRDPAGHPLVQSGLKLEGLDVARIGELLRLGGEMQGTRIVSAAEVRRLTRRSTALQPHHGLYFWLPDSGRGFAGRGYLGQHLLVLPDRGVVAVRLRHWSPEAKAGKDDFEDFEQRIERLFPPP